MAKKRKSNNRLIYILGGVVLLLIVFALVGKSQGWIGKKKELEVVTAIAERATIIEKVSASGSVQPVVEVKISPEVSGEIIELYVEEGDSVGIGNDLVIIRPDNFVSALERVRANLNQQIANLADAKARLARADASFIRAKLEYNRQKSLFDEKVTSDSDFEIADANYKIAEQDLESARQNVIAAQYIVKSSSATVSEAEENLRRTKITAPMTGTISKLNVEEGETVLGTSQFQGTEMLRIADLNEMEVRVDVNENDIIRISEGDTAIIDVDSYSYMDKSFKGIVTQIANTANDKISSDAITEFEVRIKILNSSYQDLVNQNGMKYPFRPGMTASVDIITEVKSDILTVPLAAVTTRKVGEEEEGEGEDQDADDEQTSLLSEELDEVVFIFNEGIAEKKLVEVGISDFDRIEILDGIAEGDEVISGPFLAVSKRLNDGDNVVRKEEEEKDSDSKDED